MGIGSIARAIGAGSSILGALGGSKGKAPTQISGFASLPSAQKDFASGEVWDLIKKIFNTPYQGIPRRRINAEDTDPIFGSRARQDLQELTDFRAAQQQQPAATDADAGSAAMNRGLMIQQLANQAAIAGGKMGGAITGPMSAEDYQKLGGLESDTKSIGMGDAERILSTFIGNRMRGVK